MKKCIAPSKQWPNASADVSSDEMDDFQAHADLCPYHAEILREEFEEDLRSVFRLAQGLDPEGRILRRDELQNAIAEHERLAKEWETVGRAESPFGLISLYNGGRLIASSGEFRNYTYQQALHDLDPRVGLQIRARCASDKDEEVLLGFYALRGVNHNGEELLLQLDNGYTAGVKVEQLGDRSFEVSFRCVEDGIIENEKAGAAARTEGKARGARATGFSLGGYIPAGIVPQWSDGWLSQVASWQMSALCVSLSLLLAVIPTAWIQLSSHRIRTEMSVAQMNSAYEPPESPRELPVGNIPEVKHSMGTASQSQISASLEIAAQASNTSRVREMKISFEKALAPPQNDAHHPVVTVMPSWVIVVSDHQADTVAGFTLSGNDPKLKAELRKALDEINRMWVVEDSWGASAHKTDYETFWTIIRPQGDDATESKIEVEVLSSSGDNSAPKYTLEFAISESDAGLDKDEVQNAVKNVHAQVSDLSRRTQQEFARKTVSNPTPEQEPAKLEPNSYQVKSTYCDPPQIPEPVRPTDDAGLSQP